MPTGRGKGIGRKLEAIRPPVFARAVLSQGPFKDAAGVQFVGEGVPSLTLKIPSRYTHGPIEVCSLKDVAATADLLLAALQEIGPDTRFQFIET